MNAVSTLKEYLKIFLISVVGACIMTYLSCSSCSNDLNRFATTSLFSTLMWMIMWIGNDRLTHVISLRISWVDHPIKRLVVGVISTVIFTILVAIGLLKSWEYSWNIKFGSYNEFVIISLIITFLISLFLHGREFLLQWKRSAVEAEKYQKESIMAQYNSLKSQVNPHFLFNSLNALTNLVYEDQDKAAKFIKQLSEVYRYVLDTQSKEVVPLKEELEFLDSYLFLQKIRFGDNLNIEVELTKTQSMLAPLALQLLIENAIKHNIVSSDDPLTIRLTEQGKFIVVENSLQRKTTIGEPSQGIGLENIRNRYKFLSPLPVEVNETDGKFIVKLPLIEVE
ncbi:MAG: histidine kinase [Bacteroidia bacterium]|nr:histidine kinase [Bacteroidia bacterium]